MPTKEDLSKFAQQLNSIPRPHLTPHHSASVPSTPYSHNRKNSFGARSPSPTKAMRNGSPQSIHSVVENGFRSKAPSFTGCKYETGMAFSRRRIPYSIGGDQLERANAPPKKFLSHEQEVKLSKDMRELYGRILPSKESDQKRANFVQKLGKILNEQWPGNEIEVHVFGSSGNMLCTSDSDVDICITTKMKALERVCMLAKALADHGMEKVVCVPHAKVPIVKFWDPDLELACDMNVNNTLALENTRMIKTYVEIDERVRPLAMIVKHWTKRRILNDAALGGTLSSYTWICMILNFLQTRNPPILPSLHRKPHARKAGADVKHAGFNDDLEKLRDYGKNNQESIGELLFNFFRRYAHDLDFEKDVVSVREGRLISKEAKKWHLMQNNRLCVEEPFNTERNLGNTADDTSFRGIHMELRRAFNLVSEAQLEECLEQYEFPALEEKIWEKPAPKPAPVLRSRSQSQTSRSARGGYGNRGGRNGQHKSNARRASSAAATNKYPLPPNDPLPPQGIRGRDYPSTRDTLQYQAHQQAQALHEHFMLEMQALHDQEQALRRIQQQTQEAAQLREPIERRAIQQNYNGRRTSNQVPMSVPLRAGQFYQPWIYPQVPGTPIQSIHTQPSSPSMKPAQPDLRRSLHRSNGQENNAMNMRSHSQPARPLPMAVTMQHAPQLPVNSHNYAHYQQQLQQQQQLFAAMEGRNRHMTPDALMYQASRRMPMDLVFQDNMPKEYVGYWVNDSPPSHHNGDDTMMPQLPTYQDLHPRVRGVPPRVDGLRRGSRSPSPSPALPFRDRSHSVRSASSVPMGPQRYDTVQHHNYSSRTGPIIVNGTDGWQMSDYPPMIDSSSHTTTISDAASVSDDQHYETPTTGDMETPFINGPPSADAYTMDNVQQYFNPQAATPDLARMSGLAYNSNNDTVRRRVPSQTSDTASPPSTIKRSHKTNGNAGGLGIHFGEVDFQRPSPKADLPASQEHARLATNAPTAEQSPNTPTNGQFEKPAVTAPLLSPVREVRTPSPMGKRIEQARGTAQQSMHAPLSVKKLDLHIPTFAELLRAKHEKQHGSLSQKLSENLPSSKIAEAPRAIHSSPPPKQIAPPVGTATSPPSRAALPQAMPLPLSPEQQVQQPQANGWQQQSSKKNRKSRSRPGSGQYVSGEPLPANEAERKGG